MTTAPPELVRARALMIEHLDMHPGKTVSADLDPAEVGISGDTRHVVEGDSYHLGLPEQSRDGYSVDESPRDRKGLSKYSSALDIGWFDVTVKGKRWTLRDFSRWLVNLCAAGDPDTADIREVIYSLDGRTVKRWDRQRKRSTGDSSHLTHTHISEFRDSRGRRMVKLLTRWLQHIGLLPTTTTPPPPPRRRLTIATLEADEMPKYLIRHKDHPETFALFPSGLVRHIGPAEYKAYTSPPPAPAGQPAAVPVPLLITTDKAEYERLLMYVRAIQD